MRPLPPPSLEVITDRPDRRLVVLMSTPEAVVTQARYGPGQPGASPHVHRRHAEVGELPLQAAEQIGRASCRERVFRVV